MFDRSMFDPESLEPARFDLAWLDEACWPDEEPEEPEPPDLVWFSGVAPSGWLALELDQGTVEPTRLSDSELLDAIVGFDRLLSWVGARQAELLAELAAPERTQR